MTMAAADHIDFDTLRSDPYRLLARLDERIQQQAAASGVAEGRDVWTGLGFRIGELWHLAPQPEIREVIPVPEYTRVPNARPWLMGVANVRGNLLPLIDLRMLIEGQSSDVTRQSRFLVLASDEVPAGFLVDSVSGYRRFSARDQRRDLAAEQDARWREFYLGGFVRDQEPYLVFSFQKLVRADFFQSASV